ncbi:MAG: MBL fold metallo-hydrolase [Desulfomonilaceae bacterium]
MKSIAPMILGIILSCAIGAFAAPPLETDTFSTKGGDLKITFVGHGSLFLQYQNKIIHIDPYGKLADYGTLPKADMVLITHDHPDHLDLTALKKILKPTTIIVCAPECAPKLQGAIIMKNGDTKTIEGIKIEAVPAYNMVHMRAPGQPYHPKGVGNGYILTFADKRVYVAGDTENIPEMKALRDIDVAFLPMNLPYTMTPEMVADAAKAFKPRVLYPYHTGDTDVSKLVTLMKGVEGIDVRIRKMK